MVTFLITSFLILAFLTVVVYLWQKPRTSGEPQLPPPPGEPRGLFSSVELAEAIQAVATEREQRRAAILQRANDGEKNALKDAQLEGEPAFYNAVLDSLVSRATREPQLLSLVSYVTRSELPVNITLARAVFDSWQQSPDRSSTAKALHIIALANDASLYTEAVKAVMQFWREGRLSESSAQELRSLIEGEFWLLSNSVRASGAGFLLKRTISTARRELETNAPVNQ